MHAQLYILCVCTYANRPVVSIHRILRGVMKDAHNRSRSRNLQRYFRAHTAVWIDRDANLVVEKILGKIQREGEQSKKHPAQTNSWMAAITMNNQLHCGGGIDLLVGINCISEIRHIVRPYIRPRHGSLDASRGVSQRKLGFPPDVESLVDITQALWIDILL